MNLAAYRRLAALRIVLAALWLAKMQQQRATLTRLEGGGAWHPVSWAHLLPAPPSVADATFVYGVGFVAGVMLLLGIATRWAAPVTFVAGSIGFSMLYSFGKIGHGTNLVLLCIFVLSFTPSGHVWSVDRWATRRPPGPTSSPAWAVPMMAFAAGLTYFSSGAIKLALGEFLSSENLRNIMVKRHEVTGGQFGAAWAEPVYEYLITHPTVLLFLAAATIALELAMILAWTGRWPRVLLGGSIIMFHSFIALFMGLRFGANVYIMVTLVLLTLLEIRERRAQHPFMPEPASPPAPWKAPLGAMAATAAVLLLAVWALDANVRFVVAAVNPALVQWSKFLHQDAIWPLAWFGGAALAIIGAIGTIRSWHRLAWKPPAAEAWAAAGLPQATPEAEFVEWTSRPGLAALPWRVLGAIGLTSPLGVGLAWLLRMRQRPQASDE